MTKYIPEYLAGTRAYSKKYYPFNDAKFITRAKRNFKSKGDAALSAMKSLCETYLNMDHANLEFLVGGIIDTALSDDSYNGMFFTGEKWISKDLLEQEKQYNLQAFLLSVWYDIITEYNDVSEAQGAYEAWTDQSNALAIQTTIGDRFIGKIHVSTDNVKFIKPKASSKKKKLQRNISRDTLIRKAVLCRLLCRILHRLLYRLLHRILSRLLCRLLRRILPQ